MRPSRWSSKSHSHRRRRRRWAMSFVEIMVVVVIISVALVLAMPSPASLSRTRLLATVRQLQADVYHLQTLARSVPPNGTHYAFALEDPTAVSMWRTPPAMEGLACATPAGGAVSAVQAANLLAASTLAGGQSLVCLSNADCNDNNPCTAERCMLAVCVYTANNAASCEDGLYCNGTGTCQNGSCVSSAPPCSGYCDETRKGCADCLTDAHCDDGLFCNGPEACDSGSCVSGGNPCEKGQTCDESAARCLSLGACCFSSGECSVLNESDCSRMKGSWAGANSECASCGRAATGGCCYRGACSDQIEQACLGAGGIFHAGGCPEAGCPADTGGCCTNGSCDVVSPEACSARGGNYIGYATGCEDVVCEPVVGACCVSGACSILSSAACAAASGSYHGARECATVDCPPVAAPTLPELPSMVNPPPLEPVIAHPQDTPPPSGSTSGEVPAAEHGSLPGMSYTPAPPGTYAAYYGMVAPNGDFVPVSMRPLTVEVRASSGVIKILPNGKLERATNFSLALGGAVVTISVDQNGTFVYVFEDEEQVGEDLEDNTIPWVSQETAPVSVGEVADWSDLDAVRCVFDTYKARVEMQASLQPRRVQAAVQPGSGM